MNVLLIGASGQLGSALLPLLRAAGHAVATPAHAVLDLDRPHTLASGLAACAPDLVINCAAFHQVLRCEDEPERALRVNCLAVGALARACAGRGARFVTFSSDYVFGNGPGAPWREDDLPQPLQAYGISRLAGEHAALAASDGDALVIRSCGLYGHVGSRSKGGNFVEQRIAEIARGDAVIEMACEQRVSPTAAADLAAATVALLALDPAARGVHHLVNEGACSWHELTAEIVRLLGATTRVVPVDRGGRSGTMRRPFDSSLLNTRARARGIVLPPWREALARYLRDRAPG